MYNNTEIEEVTLNKITIDEGLDWYSFSYNGQDFSLGEEVNIVIPRGQSIQLEVHMNIWAKEMLYPVLYFENTLETVSLVTALNWTESVSEQELSEIHVYPNPVENQLTIQAPGLQRVVIYNVMGQQIASIETRQDKCTITMGNYPKGLYTLQLVTENGVVNQSVIVK